MKHIEYDCDRRAAARQPNANPNSTPTQANRGSMLSCRQWTQPNPSEPNPAQPKRQRHEGKAQERAISEHQRCRQLFQPTTQRENAIWSREITPIIQQSFSNRPATYEPPKCMSSTLVYITFRERHRNQVRERAIAINIPRCHHYRQPRTALDTGIAPGGPHLSCDMTALPAPRTLYYPAVCFRTGPSGCLILWCLLLRQLSRKNMRTARPCSVAESI